MKRFTFALFLAFLLAFCQLNAQNWQLNWAEEFDYTGSPDAASWNMENWTPGWVNDEAQAYTDRLENARVENGNLIIEALKDGYNDWEWTSARLQTANKHDALYGRIEVRAILPEGTGTWPAIWMLPTDWIYGGWPTCGEIDIMEHVGKDPGTVHASIHTESYNHTINTQVTSQITVSDFNTAYHVYTIEWTPNEIKMFVDDNNYFTFQNEGTGYKEWPFDKPFHLILNVAMGGSWGGRIDRKLTSARMTIDYVRMYSYDAPADIEAPTAPQALSGTPSSSSINLLWGPSTDNYSVKEYDIYQDNTLIGTTIWQSYYVNDLQPLTNYSFKVLARDYSANESGFSSADISTIDITVHNIPAKIEAEDYDAQFGVQTEATLDEGGGENVGWIDAGDWMEYYVGVATDGDFIIDYRVASLNGGGEIQLLNAIGEVLATTAIPVTGDWQAWATVSSNTVNLPAGSNRIRVYANLGGFNMNWLEFRSVASPGDDTEPPLAPANLSIVATATTIDLSWSASTDNVAVAGYNVYKNGLFEASTQGLSYLFTGLTKRTGYTLGVMAYDAAGNESPISTINTRTSPKSATVSVAETLATYSVYPNPVFNQLNIQISSELQSSSVTLYTCLGQKVYANSHLTSEYLTVDMSKMGKGIYILEIVTKTKKESIKIVKK